MYHSFVLKNEIFLVFLALFLSYYSALFVFQLMTQARYVKRGKVKSVG